MKRDEGGRVAGKVALVTGGAAGLGEAIARLLAREGARVMVTDIDEESGARVAADIGEAARFRRLDVTDEAQWVSVIGDVMAEFGRLDVLVNNAGISEPGNIEDESYDHWKRVMTVNADSVFLGCKHAVRAMKEGGGGSIVNIASALALKAGAMFVAYCASKAAVTILTKSVALHCAENGYNIRCNSVHPGAIETPMFERYLDMAVGDREATRKFFESQHPLGRVGKPDDIAYAVVYLASDESGFVTGEELCVDGGNVIS
ncbi:MAG: glucose 1-dehydrogenase [Alphaproteobacteria bacterium]|nr:MAG: glucose 1-dehydrogenase [Alphaproteobacteria bacterium]